jgi:hypothetical protein
MSNALEMARQKMAEANAAYTAALHAHNQLKRSGTYITTQEERALKAAGLPMPENSYNFTTWNATYNAVHNAFEAVVAAREVIQTLEQSEMLDKLRASMR